MTTVSLSTVQVSDLIDLLTVTAAVADDDNRPSSTTAATRWAS
jgi:hypothetical protein